jgi:hypothetical protein
MYIEESFTKEDEGSLNAFLETNRLFPKFPDYLIEKATKMELWGSSFKDPGPDFCEFRLFEGEELIGTKVVQGY